VDCEERGTNIGGWKPVNNTEAAPWPKVDLGSLGKFRNGVNFKSSDKGTGLGLINVKDIFAGDPAIEFDTLDRVDLASRKGIERFFVKAGDLFFVRSSVKRDGVGLVSLARRSSNEIVHCGFVIRFRMTSPDADPLFLTYLLRSPYQRKTIIGTSGGSAITNISQDSLASLQIPLPPLPTQRKIAAILSAYDDLIENNTRRIAILEDMAQAIYREWFVHFRFPGHEGVRMVESELGPVPEGWKVVKLGDIAQDVRRSIKPDQVDPDTPYVGLEHIPRKSIALADWSNANQIQSTKLIFKRGEILFGKIRPYFHKVVVAPIEGICSTDTIVILPKKAKHFALVLCCVSSEHFVDYATQTSQGTKMPRADWKVLVKYPIVLSPPVILSQFSEVVQDIVAQIHNLIFRNRNLRRTRDLLLPRLISGDLDVSRLEVDIGGLDI
jgi:type I restriction enzyme S subunit